ncbi:hypothetical protein HOY34_03530 [Xinfangfangia sp. D13-10-4-6]|uniref:spermine/spermidine synthase domain-containing protein n=1 Tax=Pseudogemmobacter hezensis TaxID=2737662 RepID=UPI0015542A50|nr:hypothetical protein [Pseudogemmobacter hezensis]NPD14270.1 hypothetical protein [Pseudogemmobacter hezensis]
MTTWTDLARATNAAGDEILLRQRDTLFEIRYNGIELMSNLNHQSEAVLAERPLRLLGRRPREVLIAGLGMGFTLRAALDLLAPNARVTLCELVPEIVAWNHGRLSHLAGHPLTDPRVSVEIADVTAVLARNPGRFDAILMDTDNGPDILVRETNSAIYGDTGLSRSRDALALGGIAAFWSASVAPDFEARLTRQGWPWRRDDIALVPGRVDAMHHIYFASDDAAALGLKKAA